MNIFKPPCMPKSCFYIISCVAATVSLLAFALVQPLLSVSEKVTLSVTMLLLGCGLGVLLAREISKNVSGWAKSLYLLALCYAAFCFTSSLFGPWSTFDTWQIYDMSRYVFSDFGYMEMIRQGIKYTHYEMAFPPLFPFLMACINAVWDLGIGAAALLCYLCALLIIHVASACGRRLGCASAMALCVLMLNMMPSYIHLIETGNTQILGFYLMFLFAYVLFSPSKTLGWMCTLCAIAAIGVMNRFDFLPILVVSVVFAPWLYVIRANQRWFRAYPVALLSAVAISLVLISPWVMYSMEHFDTLFVTDNGRRLINIPDTRPNTYFPAELPALTLYDDFGTWIGIFMKRCYSSCRGLITIMYNEAWWSFVLAFLVYRMRGLLSASKLHPLRSWLLDNRASSLFFCCCILAYEAAIVMTGYSESRYHIPLVFVLCIVAFWKSSISDICSSCMTRAVLCFAFLSIMSLSCIKLTLGEFKYYMYNYRYVCDGNYADRLRLSDEEQRLKEYLSNADVGTLCIDVQKSGSIVPSRFFALSGYTTAMLPFNLSRKSAQYYIRDFKVSHIYSCDKQRMNEMLELELIEETPVENLYKVCD